jgi:hypothetical protein
MPVVGLLELRGLARRCLRCRRWSCGGGRACGNDRRCRDGSGRCRSRSSGRRCWGRRRRFWNSDWLGSDRGRACGGRLLANGKGRRLRFPRWRRAQRRGRDAHRPDRRRLRRRERRRSSHHGLRARRRLHRRKRRLRRGKPCGRRRKRRRRRPHRRKRRGKGRRRASGRQRRWTWWWRRGNRKRRRPRGLARGNRRRCIRRDVGGSIWNVGRVVEKRPFVPSLTAPPPPQRARHADRDENEQPDQDLRLHGSSLRDRHHNEGSFDFAATEWRLSAAKDGCRPH